jgi:putative AlgH/UPF0301 family transcriptional regulator
VAVVALERAIEKALLLAQPRTNGDVFVKKVVFVCIENSNRSQMAEAFARIHGAGKVEPLSAGSRPSPEQCREVRNLIETKVKELIQSL